MGENLNFAVIVGIVFIALGIFNCIAVVAWFDPSMYDVQKGEMPDLNQVELKNEEMRKMWVYGAGTLFVNVAIGAVLIVLGRIQTALEAISHKK